MTRDRDRSSSPHADRARVVVDFTDDELAELNAELEQLPASKIIQWASTASRPHLSLAASIQDAVLIDLATQGRPRHRGRVPRHGYHFAETLWYVEQVRRRYGLNLRYDGAAATPTTSGSSTPRTAARRCKVEPLDRALAGKAAWMTGLRRDEADSRADAPIVGRDLARAS